MSNKKLRPAFFNILKKQCPRCQRAPLFAEPFVLMDPIKMPENCTNCGQRFEPEPGFYIGAMFVSYVFTSFFYLSIAAITIIFAGFSANQAFALILFMALVTYLWFLRVSRSVWIHMVIKYDPNFNLEK